MKMWAVVTKDGKYVGAKGALTTMAKAEVYNVREDAVWQLTPGENDKVVPVEVTIRPWKKVK